MKNRKKIETLINNVMAKIINQRAEALNYLNKHKVIKLFDYLGAEVARAKPDDPNEFLKNELQKILELKLQQQPVSISFYCHYSIIDNINLNIFVFFHNLNCMYLNYFFKK
jgi:hypothetical protein